MSYILEALKKLEQRRQEQEVGKAPSFLRVAARVPRKRRLWIFILSAIVLVNGLALVLWLSPWRRPVPAVPAVSPSAPATPEPPTLPRTAPKQQGLSADAGTSPPVREVERPLPPAKVQPLGEAPPAAVAKGAPVEKTAPERQAARRKEMPDPAFPVGELPPFIREALPQFRVTGHAYSADPKGRVVRVNDKVLLEGQELQPGLVVEEVLRDGIVFTFQGYRFRVPAGGER